MKINLSHIATPLIVALMTVGCAAPDETVKLKGKKYAKDSEGAVVLSESQFRELKSEYAFMEGQNPHVSLTQEEYDLVMNNDEALFSLIGQADKQESTSTLIRPGSLKKNMERIVKENGWNTLYFDGPDYYVEAPFIIEEEDVTTSVIHFASDYPLYTCFDEESKTVTVIQSAKN